MVIYDNIKLKQTLVKLVTRKRYVQMLKCDFYNFS